MNFSTVYKSFPSLVRRVSLTAKPVQGHSFATEKTLSPLSLINRITLGYSGTQPISFRLFNEAEGLLKNGNPEKALKIAVEAKKTFDDEYKKGKVTDKGCREVIDILISNAEKSLKKR